MEYVSLMRVRAPRTKHKEKGIPGWYSFLLVPYIGVILQGDNQGDNQIGS